MQSTSRQEKPQRRYDLDWLRVFAVLLLLYFHTAAIFYKGDLGEFYVQSDRPSAVMNLFIVFVYQWHMPLFFLLSGAGTWFALSFRSAKQYVQERVERLFVPFLFGTLVLIPPQVYFRLLSHSDYKGSYFQFYPLFFNGIRPQGNFEWGHLWFLIYLFTFSLIALPLLLYLRSAPLRLILARWMELPGAILLLALPLAAIEGALRPGWIGFQNLYDDWANVCLYLVYFIYGYLICSDERFGAAIDKHLGAAMVLAMLCMATLLGLGQHIPDRGYSLSYVLYQCFRGFNTWFWVIALLGLGRRYLNFNSDLLQYLHQTSYPFYLLHQTVVVAIGFYVLRWHINITAGFLLISTAALIATIALSAAAQHHNLARFFFGLKPTRPL